MRRFNGSAVAVALALLSLSPIGSLAAGAELYLGSGTKVGEIRHNAAIVHVRLTAAAEQDEERLIPGHEGQARLRYGLDAMLSDRGLTDWQDATSEDDYSTQFCLKELKPGQRYFYQVEYRADPRSAVQRSDVFSFPTAPARDVRAAVRFQVTTGQDVRGADTYLAMAAQKPHFLVSTGDNVYYDGAGKAHDVPGAYRAYQRMYGLPQMKAYFQQVGGYFEKDDHDYRFNDSDRWQQVKGGDGLKWPDKKRRDKKPAKPQQWLTHEEGVMVFKKVYPMSDPTYRTFRWGQGVQIWLVEGRDYRSPNAMPDGPDKTLWGAEQREWLKRTLLESDADWRVLISPTPIIGPDRVTKVDNHANPHGFWTEGQAFLDWIKESHLDNVILACGDRHWQYHSLDQRNGRRIHEFSCGPTCDKHTAPVPPIVTPFHGVTQPYSRSIGGFLTATYQPDRTLTFEFFDRAGKSAYRCTFEK
ncbi:MAG: alkaline phosphatase [Pirellulaceae bacterium]